MRNSEQLRAEAKSARELLTRATLLEELDHALKGKKDMTLLIDGLCAGIPVSQAILQQAVIQYANSERAALRALGVEASRDDFYPYVTYSGKQSSTGDAKITEVEFPAGLVPAVSDSLSQVKAENGSWMLRTDGTLIMTVVKCADSQVSAGFSVKTATDQAGKLYVSGLDSTLEEINWNKPEDLPPVGCDLLIKVPAGTEVVTVSSNTMVMAYTTDVERVFKVFRTSHLADRAGDMEYRLPDNCTVTGRFPWTYP